MQKKRPSKARNFLLIGALVAAAVILIFVSKSQTQQPRTQDDLNLLLQTLGTVPPAAPSSAPSAEVAPEPTPVPNLPAKEPTLSPQGTAEAYVLISVDSQSFSLEPLDKERDVVVEQANGEKNVVHITHNGFHMASSTCDNQLCVGEGLVTTENYVRRIMGKYVLCLPNRVTLELVIPNATTPPDMLDI